MNLDDYAFDDSQNCEVFNMMNVIITCTRMYHEMRIFPNFVPQAWAIRTNLTSLRNATVMTLFTSKFFAFLHYWREAQIIRNGSHKEAFGYLYARQQAV